MTSLVVAVGFVPTDAQAQNADAEALFAEGERLEAAGQIAAACDTFEASNRIEPRAGTMIRLGQCREGQGRVASAWSAFKDSLTRAKDPAKRRIAEQRIAALESRMSTLTVLVPDTSRIDGLVIERNGVALDAALWNRAAPVDGGVYTIGGRAPGHETWTTTVEVAGENDGASIEVPRFKELRQLVETVPPGRETGAERATTLSDAELEQRLANRPARRRLTPRRKLAIGLSAMGIAAIGGGVVVAIGGRELERNAYALCPEPATPCNEADAAQALHDRARSRGIAADVAFGAGGAAVIGAAVLWITGAPPPASRRISISPFVRPGASGAGVTVRF